MVGIVINAYENIRDGVDDGKECISRVIVVGA